MMIHWIQLKITEDETAEVPFAALPTDKEVVLLLPCTHPEHFDQYPVGVLRLTKDMARDILAKFEAIADLPGETPAYVSYWDYRADFVELHSAAVDTDKQDAADMLVDAAIDATSSGEIIALTEEQVSLLTLDDTLRSNCEKLEIAPPIDKTDPKRGDFWWSIDVKYTDFTVDTHPILADDLRKFLGDE